MKDPRRKAEDIVQAEGVTTKTVKRRLDKLVEARILSFSVIFRTEAITDYLIFYVLLRFKNGSSSKVLETIRANCERYLFSETIVQPNVIFLMPFSKKYMIWIEYI